MIAAIREINRRNIGTEHSDIDASFSRNGAWILPQLWKTKCTFSTAAWTGRERAAHRLHTLRPLVKASNTNYVLQHSYNVDLSNVVANL
jgi:hypothetical protein